MKAIREKHYVYYIIKKRFDTRRKCMVSVIMSRAYNSKNYACETLKRLPSILLKEDLVDIPKLSVIKTTKKYRRGQIIKTVGLPFQKIKISLGD